MVFARVHGRDGDRRGCATYAKSVAHDLWDGRRGIIAIEFAATCEEERGANTTQLLHEGLGPKGVLLRTGLLHLQRRSPYRIRLHPPVHT